MYLCLPFVVSDMIFIFQKTQYFFNIESYYSKLTMQNGIIILLKITFLFYITSIYIFKTIFLQLDLKKHLLQVCLSFSRKIMRKLFPYF